MGPVFCFGPQLLWPPPPPPPGGVVIGEYCGYASTCARARIPPLSVQKWPNFGGDGTSRAHTWHLSWLFRAPPPPLPRPRGWWLGNIADKRAPGLGPGSPPLWAKNVQILVGMAPLGPILDIWRCSFSSTPPSLMFWTGSRTGWWTRRGGCCGMPGLVDKGSRCSKPCCPEQKCSWAG